MACWRNVSLASLVGGLQKPRCLIPACVLCARKQGSACSGQVPAHVESYLALNGRTALAQGVSELNRCQPGGDLDSPLSILILYLSLCYWFLL